MGKKGRKIFCFSFVKHRLRSDALYLVSGRGSKGLAFCGAPDPLRAGAGSSSQDMGSPSSGGIPLGLLVPVPKRPQHPPVSSGQAPAPLQALSLQCWDADALFFWLFLFHFSFPSITTPPPVAILNHSSPTPVLSPHMSIRCCATHPSPH